MKGFKKWKKKALQIPIHVRRYRYQKCTTCFFVIGIGTILLLPSFSLMGTSTSECGTDTILLLPCFSALVSVPILVVPVPLYKNFHNSLHFGFHCILASCIA